MNQLAIYSRHKKSPAGEARLFEVRNNKLSYLYNLLAGHVNTFYAIFLFIFEKYTASIQISPFFLRSL